MSTLAPRRRRIVGVAGVHQALDAEEPVQLILLPREDLTPTQAALQQRATALGIQLWLGGPGDMRRMSPDSDSPADALALVGDGPCTSVGDLLGLGGAVWLLHRPAYPSNVGFMVRTAEVSGATGVIIDAPDFNREQRSRVSHVSMGADRVMPVLWARSEQALGSARQQDMACVAIEDCGTHAPHQLDLTGPALLVLGNERSGIAPAVRTACDLRVRIPMLGFVPSYSVQAAMAIIAGERLRQLQVCSESSSSP